MRFGLNGFINLHYSVSDHEVNNEPVLFHSQLGGQFLVESGTRG
jgi:hypothetical protein